MKRFKYQAKKGPQETLQGTLLAENREDAIGKINELGLFPIDVNEEFAETIGVEKSAPISIRIPPKEFILFYRQIAKLVSSGVPILKALSFVSEQAHHKRMREVLGRISGRVGEGSSFSEAMGACRGVFGPFDLAMVQAGESVGRLDESLKQIAEYREDQQKLIAKVKTALTYPFFVILMGAITVVVMLVRVVPEFSRFFSDLGQELPMPTRVLMMTSDWLRVNGLWFLVGVAVIFFASVRSLKVKSQKIWWHGLALRVPIVGDLILKSQLARLCRTLELLLKRGMQLLNALRVATPVLTNLALQEEIGLCYSLVERGGSFSDGLKRSKFTPPFVLQLVKIGEESGKLDEVLAEIAGWYEEETAETVQRITNLLEPIVILLVGLILGFIVVAVLLPVFSMSAVTL